MGEFRVGVGMASFGIPGWEESRDGTPLAARCLVLDDGVTRFALISATCLAIWPADSQAVRASVSQATGLASEDILIACTHVHSGPPVLTQDRELRLTHVRHIACACAKAAERASASIAPARFGFAASPLPGVSRVRRVLRRDGSVITLRRAWPQYWGWATDADTVGPEEPNDDLLTVARLDDERGRPIAAVVHFTCHPIPDYFGYAARLVEAQFPGLVCLILNGCFGTVDTPFEIPMQGRTQADQLPVLGDALGHRAVELLADVETSGQTPLGATSRPVSLPLDPTFRADPSGGAEIWGQALADGRLDTEVQCLRIGDLAFVGIPGEAQVGFGRSLAEVSPFALTRGIGNANESVAYLLTAESRARGGYEGDPSHWSIVTGEGLPIILDAARSGLLELEARHDLDPTDGVEASGTVCQRKV